MKRIILSLLALVSITAYGQSDGCSAAKVISVTPTCAAPTAGTTIGATGDFDICITRTPTAIPTIVSS